MLTNEEGLFQVNCLYCDTETYLLFQFFYFTTEILLRLIDNYIFQKSN